MFAWFLTKNGRLFTHAAVGVATASIFGLQMSLHGPLIHKYQELLQMYKKGKPREVHPDILAMAKEVLQQCDLTEKQRNRISFYVTPGLDTYHAGGYNSPFGAIIGLPPTFGDKFDELDSELVLVGKHDFDWVVEGLDLLETLKLSLAARKFVIAREIYLSNIHRVIENASIGALCFYLPASLSKFYNTKVDNYRFKFTKRLVVYTFMYTLGLLFYICIRDPLKHLTEMDADRKAAKLSPEFLQGGLEFYQKMLQRNRELRDIFGKAGQSRFTMEGNENYKILAPKLPVSKRLALLQKLEMEKH